MMREVGGEPKQLIKKIRKEIEDTTILDAMMNWKFSSTPLQMNSLAY